MSTHKHVCPVSLAGGLDNWVRRLVHRPEKILSPFLEEGMTAVDYGCGPGYFTIPMARMVGPAGRVIAADLQQGMLDLVAAKAAKHGLSGRIIPHLCSGDAKIAEKADFALLFYVAHEVPDVAALFADFAAFMKRGGKVLFVEPPFFHVAWKEFQAELELAKAAGFTASERLHMGPDRGVVLTRN
ncbi:MAG TPA: methyltransferase domain-containing protein [Opitutales bacterium]|nr:methyltransferase domain-containing protein [Opitutales bacterium]